MRGIGISVGILLGSTYLSRFNLLRDLFGSGEQGAWYDPSDLTTLFQDSAGNTPVTATGQTVGLMLDKSQGLVLGPELVTNGDFSQGATGWTVNGNWAIAGGVAVNSGAVTNEDLISSASLIAGRVYEVSYEIIANSGGSASLFIRVGSQFITSFFGSPLTPGVKTARVFTTGGGILVFRAVAGQAVTIDNISVKELPGNHATQSSLASRPILGREPFGGRRNLLTFTEQFDNAAWTKANATVTANTTAAPDGTLTADALVENTASNVHYVSASVTTVASAYTLSVYAKPAGRSWIYIRVADSGNIARVVWFNITDGTVGVTGAGITASIQTVGNGWYRCIATIAVAFAGSQSPRIGLSTANNTESYTGDGASGAFVWGAQLELGSTATAYQRVTDQWDVTQAGVPEVYYVNFDGSDDFMLTGTITPGIDKAQVFAGVRKLSDAAQGILVETGTNIVDGGLSFIVPNANTTPGYRFTTRGTITSNAIVSSGYAAPITNVLTGLGDISGDSAILRVNGTQAASSAIDQGTGNFLAYPLYIGRRAGGTLPFNGRIYSLIVRFGANLPLATIQQTEAWVADKTGLIQASSVSWDSATDTYVRGDLV